MTERPAREALQDYGLSNDNIPINKDRLLYAPYSSYSGSESNLKEIVKVLQDNPDRESDKKAIMRKTGLESSINSTTNQGLGSVIDNMPYYVDSCAWWIKGWDVAKYKKSLTRDKKKVRRKPVPRIANRPK